MLSYYIIFKISLLTNIESSSSSQKFMFTKNKFSKISSSNLSSLNQGKYKISERFVDASPSKKVTQKIAKPYLAIQVKSIGANSSQKGAVITKRNLCFPVILKVI